MTTPEPEQALDRVLQIATTRRGFLSGVVSALNHALLPKLGPDILGPTLQYAIDLAFQPDNKPTKPTGIKLDIGKLIATHQGRLLVARAESLLLHTQGGYDAITVCTPLARAGISLGLKPEAALKYLAGCFPYRPVFETQALIHAASGNIAAAREALGNKKDNNSWWSRGDDFWTDYGVSLQTHGASIEPELERFHNHIKSMQDRYGKVSAIDDQLATFQYAATGHYPKGFLSDLESLKDKILPDHIAVKIAPTGDFERAMYYFKLEKGPFHFGQISRRIAFINLQLQNRRWREALEVAKYTLDALKTPDPQLQKFHQDELYAEIFGLRGRALAFVDQAGAKQAFQRAEQHIGAIDTSNPWFHLTRAENFTLLGEQQHAAGLVNYTESFNAATSEYTQHGDSERARTHNKYPHWSFQYSEPASRQAKLGYRPLADAVISSLSQNRKSKPSIFANGSNDDYDADDRAYKAPKEIRILASRAEFIAANGLTREDLEKLSKYKNELVKHPDPAVKEAASAIL